MGVGLPLPEGFSSFFVRPSRRYRELAEPLISRASEGLPAAALSAPRSSTPDAEVASP